MGFDRASVSEAAESEGGLLGGASHRLGWWLYTMASIWLGNQIEGIGAQNQMP